MNPNGPWTPPGGGAPGAMFVHDGGWWLGVTHLISLLLLATLIGVLIWGVLRLTSERSSRFASVAAPRGAAVDHALETLRVRYARGEVDRTEYLERSADLGGPSSPEAPPDRTLRGSPADQE